ncbi:hypothetical protein [Campylobacter sp. RM16187]|uniref:hypothetical protein n=1 Tax=Campylobacter sp. RM16187 TaxID=1660063 RepID=UPI0021B67BB2|nr:hypothetical protein [Campylobacter sp. RM16187]QKG28767.1 hypothetical protein CDOMF_0485 [Campylobacter sp. RM16187]
MNKIIFFFLFSIFLFGSDSEFGYFKSKFSTMSSQDVTSFLCKYLDSDEFSLVKYKYFSSYTSYSSSCSGNLFSGSFSLSYSRKKNILNPVFKIDKDNYAEFKRGILRLFCNNPVFKASFYSNVRFDIKIYDGYGEFIENLLFGKNMRPSCF